MTDLMPSLLLVLEPDEKFLSAAAVESIQLAGSVVFPDQIVQLLRSYARDYTLQRSIEWELQGDVKRATRKEKNLQGARARAYSEISTLVRQLEQRLTKEPGLFPFGIPSIKFSLGGDEVPLSELANKLFCGLERPAQRVSRPPRPAHRPRLDAENRLIQHFALLYWFAGGELADTYDAIEGKRRVTPFAAAATEYLNSVANPTPRIQDSTIANRVHDNRLLREVKAIIRKLRKEENGPISV